jgi:pyruvate/2-oxoglutarate dehydrogenase complex dihydrolipoamide dehydrogenase (E3) component
MAYENPQGGVALSVVMEGNTETVRGTHLLVATGRRPSTDDLGLQDAGVQTDQWGFIRVNTCRTWPRPTSHRRERPAPGRSA